MATDQNRKTAYDVLLDIEDKGAYSNLSLNRYIGRNAPDAPAFIRELVYGVLENRIYLDFLLDHYLKNSVKDLKTRERTLLRMGMYQLEFMNSVPAYAAVNGTVELAKKFCRGREGFINGVLRTHLRRTLPVELPNRGEDEIRFLSIKYSYTPWIVRFWLEEYGPTETEALLAAGNATPDLVIRANRLKNSREALRKQLEEKGYQTEESRWIPEALKIKGEKVLSDTLYKEGAFSVQDEASMLAVSLLDPRPGEMIMDVCAAPGGKTLFMAERMENKGMILAGDVSETRLDLIKKEALRIGVSLIKTRVWDGSKADPEMAGKADRVLVDAPCSGLGVIRRKPEIKYKEYDEGLENLPEKQLAILTASSTYSKPGGILVYSTCTISGKENREVVEAFLSKVPYFKKQDEIQLLPNKDGTDGFYIAKLIRQLEN